jgi:hypothetical protein
MDVVEFLRAVATTPNHASRFGTVTERVEHAPWRSSPL